jgi:hypothetical protein
MADTRAWLRLKGIRDVVAGLVVLTMMLHSIESDRALIKPSNLPMAMRQKGQKGPR